MKRIFVLIKDTPELKKGALMREQCSGGGQDFECINIDTHVRYKAQKKCYYQREVVLKQPKWFTEVVSLYICKSDFAKIKKEFKKVFIKID